MTERLFCRLLSFTIAISIGSLTFLASSGCGNGSSQRVAVWGDVTWKGQPVPAGVIYFNPDKKKGNTGPQGFALIQDGHFDSRAEFSKGCVTGPLVALIQGCTGEGKSSNFPYGRPLLAPVELPLDVPAEGGQIDLTIPDSAAPATVGANAEIE
ncbi:MAG: hypothetical protein WD468_09835 [Pirellulales bacterium]